MKRSPRRGRCMLLICKETDPFAQCLILEISESRHSLNDSVDVPEIGGEDWESRVRWKRRYNVGIVWGQSEKGLQSCLSTSFNTANNKFHWIYLSFNSGVSAKAHAKYKIKNFCHCFLMKFNSIQT